MTTKFNCWADGAAILINFKVDSLQPGCYHSLHACIGPFTQSAFQASVSSLPIDPGLSMAQPWACKRVDMTATNLCSARHRQSIDEWTLSVYTSYVEVTWPACDQPSLSLSPCGVYPITWLYAPGGSTWEVRKFLFIYQIFLMTENSPYKALTCSSISFSFFLFTQVGMTLSLHFFAPSHLFPIFWFVYYLYLHYCWLELAQPWGTKEQMWQHELLVQQHDKSIDW